MSTPQTTRTPSWRVPVNVALYLLTVVALHLVLGTFEIVYLKRTDALE